MKVRGGGGDEIEIDTYTQQIHWQLAPSRETGRNLYHRRSHHQTPAGSGCKL